MKDSIHKFLATSCYLGYFPVAPGTVSSLVGFVLYYFLMDQLFVFALLTVVITVLGFVASGSIEEILGQKDPSCVVIDEVAGSMIAVFLLPWEPAVMITAFFLFRAFDMFKIYPSNRLEKLHGATGIMMDDVVAGIYTNITMHIAIYLTVIV